MVTALLAVAGALLAYAVYLATLSLRWGGEPGEFLDAGGTLAPWAYIFAAGGVVLAGAGFDVHLLMTWRFGLAYNHVAIGLVLAALTGALLQKRIWLAARITGTGTAGALLGDYYQSPSIRIAMLVVLALFAGPFAAEALARFGALLEEVTAGHLPRVPSIWATAFFLFLFSAIGGWRGIVYVVAGVSFLAVVLAVFLGGIAVADLNALEATALATAPGGVLADGISGVAQFHGGIGKAAAGEAIWTTAAILSFSIALVGLVLSPGYALLAITTGVGRGLAFGQVWITAGLVPGTLLLIVPLLANQLAAAGAPFAELAGRLAMIDQLLAASLVVVLGASAVIVATFFVGSAASIVTSELLARDILPELSPAGRKLAARIALAALYALAALLASFAPTLAFVLGSVTLSLSAQLLPAYLGLCWVPWISRSAVLTGVIAGTLFVVFTEPLGLVPTEELFLELPWGRWPWTIHSAAWGLAFNAAACLLVSIFTRAGPEREHRMALHYRLALDHPAALGGRAVRGARWSLSLLWLFFALGPGAIIGNFAFTRPAGAGGEVSRGLHSLWTWQVLFWLLGILLVWWLAYQARLGIVETVPPRRVELQPASDSLLGRRRPHWISLFLARVAERHRQP